MILFLRLLLRFSFNWEYLSQGQRCTAFANTSKITKNAPLSVVFATLILVLGNVELLHQTQNTEKRVERHATENLDWSCLDIL